MGWGFNSDGWDETGDGQRELMLLPREGLLPERQPECPPPVGRASVRACLLLSTRKSHHKLQSQGSLHVFPAAWRAIYILVFNIACKLRTDLLFFSHTMSSSYWGDAGTSGESHAAGSWRKRNLFAELVHSWVQPNWFTATWSSLRHLACPSLPFLWLEMGKDKSVWCVTIL